MLTETALQALLGGTLPAGARLFLVAAVPIEGPLPTSSAAQVDISQPSAPALADSAKTERLVRALQKVEPNDTRQAILDRLLASAEGDWVPFPSMIASVEKVGVSSSDAPGRAQAALRDLSWQFKTYLPPEDLVGCTVAIDVLATRRRFGKETRYRLTGQGRAALAALAAKHS